MLPVPLDLRETGLGAGAAQLGAQAVGIEPGDDLTGLYLGAVIDGDLDDLAGDFRGDVDPLDGLQAAHRPDRRLPAGRLGPGRGDGLDRRLLVGEKLRGLVGDKPLIAEDAPEHDYEPEDREEHAFFHLSFPFSYPFPAVSGDSAGLRTARG